MGGYLCASAEVIEYLRFYARASMYTASLPPSDIAGLAEAFRVMDDEPEHRQRLWHNAGRLHQGLRDAGFPLEPLESPILTVPVGEMERLLVLGRALYQAGIKCGTVSYPAVPKHKSLLRLSINARHREDDIDFTVKTLAELGTKFGLLRPAHTVVQ
jgi:7-keto-8-aminopelargonate synthetase-like enzyme